MANLKEIRNRISSVKTISQVTSAMKMVSAARLKKAQDSILQIRPYAERLHELLESLSASLDQAEDSVFTQHREPNKVLIVAISSNRGLCGAFNSNVAKKTIDLATSKYPDQLKKGNVQIIAIGKQGEKLLKSAKLNVIAHHNDLLDNLSFETVSAIASELMSGFVGYKYDRIELVYNKFKNAAVQLISSEQFLPIEEEKSPTPVKTNYDFIFEPSRESLIQELIPRSLKIQFYKTLLESNAAEHGARMTSMHKATDNANELIRELTLTFNKARQTAITNEILEVTNGAEALNG